MRCENSRICAQLGVILIAQMLRLADRTHELLLGTLAWWYIRIIRRPTGRSRDPYPPRVSENRIIAVIATHRAKPIIRIAIRIVDPHRCITDAEGIAVMIGHFGSEREGPANPCAAVIRKGPVVAEGAVRTEAGAEYLERQGPLPECVADMADMDVSARWIQG